MTNPKNIRKKRWFKLLIALIVLAVVLVLLFILLPKSKKNSDEKRNKRATELFNQGQEALSNRNYQESVDKLLQANELRPNDYNTVYSLAMAYYGLKDYAGSEKYYAIASQSPKANKSSIAMIYNNLGNIYRDQNQTEKAESAYKQAIGLDPHLTYSYMNLAVMYYNDNKTDRAIEILRQGVSAVPSASDLADLLKKYIQKR